MINDTRECQLFKCIDVTKRMSFQASLIVLVFGSYLIGVLHGAYIEFLVVYKMSYVLRFISTGVVFIFVIISIALVFLKSAKLKSLGQRITTMILGFYICLCLVTFLLLGNFSPLVLAGTLSYQIYRGVNVSALFYPLISNQSRTNDIN